VTGKDKDETPAEIQRPAEGPVTQASAEDPAATRAKSADVS
jgi:hypothetical protein